MGIFIEKNSLSPLKVKMDFDLMLGLQSGFNLDWSDLGVICFDFNLDMRLELGFDLGVDWEVSWASVEYWLGSRLGLGRDLTWESLRIRLRF